MIDLGLPSGTLWACCNVGAKAPEEYGDYFAWGETKTKVNYNWDTYSYGNSDGNVEDIGSDIAGTEYDAATANWGAPWRMPTREQCRELEDHCSWEWTKQNGVYGHKVIGPSEGIIFLPAAGYRWDGDLNAVQYGHYWSSTLFEYGQSHACGISFGSEGASLSNDCPGDGQPVRPVCKK